MASGAQAQGQYGRGGTPGEFDFYVLALSWSPGFCELEGDRERSREQCESGANLGFVVHGLWPQYERGYPSDCGPAGRTPSRIALEQTKGLFPSEGLARYEWRKHGTCSGSSPGDYFADVRRARDKIVIPPALQQSERDQTWAALDLERAFAAANPGLRPDMMSIACKRGVLQEVRICMSKDLRNFQTCQQVDRSGCRTRDITVKAVR
ncbi:ribonuclease T2 [Bosea sp. BK604]|uniref:ribonuclease T2 family protein n=1 Tax=Bosea sp. BK604 TaxID=2512180 RepID=UPI001043489F|nr:ribonuclease T2 [Bosea sp. BK604]